MKLSIRVTNADRVPLRFVIKQLDYDAPHRDVQVTVASNRSVDLAAAATREVMIMLGTSGIEQNAAAVITNVGSYAVHINTGHQFGNVAVALLAGESRELEFISSRVRAGGAAAAVIRVTV